MENLNKLNGLYSCSKDPSSYVNFKDNWIDLKFDKRLELYLKVLKGFKIQCHANFACECPTSCPVGNLHSMLKALQDKQGEISK